MFRMRVSILGDRNNLKFTDLYLVIDLAHWRGGVEGQTVPQDSWFAPLG